MRQIFVKLLFFALGLLAFAGSFFRLNIEIPEFLTISPDKTQHIILSMMLLILLQLSYKKLNLLLGFLLLLIGSVMVELLQHFLTTSRSFDLKDIYANLIGLMLGAITVVLFNLIFNKKIK